MPTSTAGELRFRAFVIFSLVVTLALAGWSFAKSEIQGDKLSHQTSSLSHVVTHQSEDREAAVQKNVEARREDCNNGNQVRLGLRIGVEQSRRQRPLLLQLFPQFNQPKVLALVVREERRQLKAYAPLDCEAYALRALPAEERVKVTLAEQQRILVVQQKQIRGLLAKQAADAKKSAKSRVTTVTQRCELTELVLRGTAVKPRARAKLAGSLAGCHKQLAKVKAEAAGA
jgi:hypothetical protein